MYSWGFFYEVDCFLWGVFGTGEIRRQMADWSSLSHLPCSSVVYNRLHCCPNQHPRGPHHYHDVIMGAIASQITSLAIFDRCVTCVFSESCRSVGFENRIPLQQFRWTPGGRFGVRALSCRCGGSHCGEETILRPSCLHGGISCAGGTASLYWIGPWGFSLYASKNSFSLQDECVLMLVWQHLVEHLECQWTRNM